MLNRNQISTKFTLNKIFSKLYLPFAVLALFVNSGCDEAVNPKSEFRDLYVMNGIVDITPVYGVLKSHYSVYLNKTFDVPGLTADNAKVVNPVTGALISLTINNRFSELREKRKTPGLYDSLDVLPDNANLEIHTQLPDGTMLSASTKIPPVRAFETNYEFIHGFTTKFNQFNSNYLYLVSWAQSRDDNHIFFPRFTLNYNAPDGKHSEIIPVTYLKQDNRIIPVYPNYTKEVSLAYDFNSFDSVMTKISAGIDNKSSIQIINLRFDLVEFDTPLSLYYSSTKGSMDNFSIRTDENIFTNVRGGVGIFGSLMRTNFTMFLDKPYIQSFGYTEGSASND